MMISNASIGALTARTDAITAEAEVMARQPSCTRESHRDCIDKQARNQCSPHCGLSRSLAASSAARSDAISPGSMSRPAAPRSRPDPVRLPAPRPPVGPRSRPGPNGLVPVGPAIFMPVQRALAEQVLHHGLHRVERQRPFPVQPFGDFPNPHRPFPGRRPGRPDHVHDGGLQITESRHTASCLTPHRPNPRRPAAA